MVCIALAVGMGGCGERSADPSSAPPVVADDPHRRLRPGRLAPQRCGRTPGESIDLAPVELLGAAGHGDQPGDRGAGDPRPGASEIQLNAETMAAGGIDLEFFAVDVKIPDVFQLLVSITF